MIFLKITLKTAGIFFGSGSLAEAVKEIYPISALFECNNSVLKSSAKKFPETEFCELNLNSLTDSKEQILRVRPDFLFGEEHYILNDFGILSNEYIGKNSFDVFTSFVEYSRPNMFLFVTKNKEGLKKEERSFLISGNIRALKTAGYGISEVFLNMSNLGIPQRKTEHFVFGMLEEKNGFLDSTVKKFIKENKVPKRTIEEYLKSKGFNIDFDYFVAKKRQRHCYPSVELLSVFKQSIPIDLLDSSFPPPENENQSMRFESGTAHRYKIKHMSFEEKVALQTFEKDELERFEKFPDSFKEQIVSNSIAPVSARTIVSIIDSYLRK